MNIYIYVIAALVVLCITCAIHAHHLKLRNEALEKEMDKLEETAYLSSEEREALLMYRQSSPITNLLTRDEQLIVAATLRNSRRHNQADAAKLNLGINDVLTPIIDKLEALLK